MAVPRVFISSTCYDLAEARDSLLDFIKSYGFEPVLSDRGDVFYHPDLHTHESCLNEICNCQMLILIIGGRFGGTYVADPSKSIVNAEYAAARDSKIPVFTFVKRDVHSDHFVFSKNKSNKTINAENILYPSIEKNGIAAKIFEFIDDVRHSSVNNGFFTFDLARDIVNLLRKQWAAMFFDFLQNRNLDSQLELTTNLLANLKVASEKVEEISKLTYRHLDKTMANEKIAEIDQRSEAKKFFERVFRVLSENEIEFSSMRFANPSAYSKWYEYIAYATHGKIEIQDSDKENLTIVGINYKSGGSPIVDGKGDFPWLQSVIELNRQLQSQFEIVKKMPEQEILEIVTTSYNDVWKSTITKNRSASKPKFEFP